VAQGRSSNPKRKINPQKIMMVFLAKLLSPALSPVLIIAELVLISIFTIRRWPRLARAAAIAALVVLMVGGNTWFAYSVADSLELRYVPEGPLPAAQAIVVLASYAEPGRPPSPTVSMDSETANRLLYGAQLYREHRAPTVILSGGTLPWLRNVAPMSEAMAEVIELLGVPKSAIIQDTGSANTYENALGVKAILEDRHIGRILLVTSAMHMPRAMALFKHQGIDAIAAPCDFTRLVGSDRGGWQGALLHLIPEAGNLVITTLVSREYLGMAVYRATGRL
jgi:uncharacterized SAM-binding protein YcdF (DUF218 family)